MLIRKITLIIFLGIFLQQANAQWGLNLRYSSNDFTDWSDISTQVNGGPIFENHFEVGVDRWFKPGTMRAEYMLEASFGRASTSLTPPGFSTAGVYTNTMFGLGSKSNIYIFDFFGDCDCPTFTKQGTFFKKGFFLQWNAKVNYWLKDANFFVRGDNGVTVDVGGGIGIDIGISDLITISPVITYHYFPWITWRQYGLQHGRTIQNLNDKITATMFKFGFRIGLRSDYMKEKRVLGR